jgi:tetratricopeptide (TPR) repeat protein
VRGSGSGGEQAAPTLLGRHASEPAQAWHVRWTQAADALRTVHEAHVRREVSLEAEAEALERLAALPLFHGLAIPGATMAAKGRAAERMLRDVLGRLRARLTTPVSRRDLAAQAILCWCLHVLDGLPMKAVARELAGRHLARRPGEDWKGSGWAAAVRAQTVRARMWPRGIRSPRDYPPGAGEGLRRIVEAVDAALRPFEKAASPTGLGPDRRPPLLVSGQLAPAPHFTDRRRELGGLDQWLLARPDHRADKVMVITGIAGVGKTALARRWLHGLIDRFPDGELCADLRGYGTGPPKTPGEILGRFLRALGVPSDCVPSSLDEQTALYRSLMASRRMLVLLDDAASTGQVRPLLPGSSESVVVVTSRRRLAGLLAGGAGLLSLGPLREPAAVELLARYIGTERIEAEPAAARALVRFCGGLPIALAVAAARLLARPRSPIASMVAELRDARRRLEALSVEDVSVRATFDLSYRALPADAARLYRLIGLLPGADCNRAVAAAAANLPVEDADRLLSTLIDASMLEERGEDSFGLHDLLHLHARLQAEASDAPAERQAAVRRALNWYLASATAADQTVMPHRRRHARPYASPPSPPVSFDGACDALAWLEAERSNLMAAVRVAAEWELRTTAWQLVDAMWSLFLYHKHYDEWIESHRIGIAAAQADGDWGGETMLLNHLGLAFHGLGRFKEARECFEQALVRHREVGDRWGEATALNSLGLALGGLGRTQDAISHFMQATGIHQEFGDRRGEALTRVNLGRAYGRLGHVAKARHHLMRARSVFASLPDRYNEARVLHSLGGLYARSDQANAAIGYLESALGVMRELGSRFEEAQVLEILGDAVHLTGDERAARSCYQQALGLYQEIGGPYADRLWERVKSSNSGRSRRNARQSR